MHPLIPFVAVALILMFVVRGINSQAQKPRRRARYIRRTPYRCQ